MDAMEEALLAMLEEPADNEMVSMNEGVWLKEEEITEMVESLMNDDDTCLKESGESGLKMKSPQDKNNEIEIIQIHDEEDGSDKVMVQQDEEVQGNYLFAGEDDSCLGYKYWWEAYALASGGDNYTEYNWCFEDDMKMWEWSEYSYIPSEFPQHFEMSGLIEGKAASEA